MRDKTYVTGVTIVVISFIACVLSYYLIFFALPVFILGTIIVFFSKRTIAQKLLTTLLPLILWLPSTYLFLTLYNYTPPKTFLIPADYEGKLRIVYGEDCGIEPIKENGKQLLEFQSNGLLILKNRFDGGLNNEYYLVDENGKRTKCNEIQYGDIVKKNHTIAVTGSGTMGGSETSKGIMFSDFYIFNKDTIGIETAQYANNFDKQTDSLVNECRSKK